MKSKINEIPFISKNYDILLITETKLKEGDKYSIPGFNCYVDIGESTSSRKINLKK